MTTDLTVPGGAAPAPRAAYEAETRELIKAQIMPHRTDKQGKDLGPATDAETDLILAEAREMGLSILGGQAKPIRFENGGPVVLQPTWTGLVKQAQDTGEYGGIEVVLYTDGTRTERTDEWGNVRRDYVWQDGWDDDVIPPVACKVGIWRKGNRRPSWGTAHYSTWGTDPDPDGWSNKLDANGKPIQRKNRRTGEWYNVRVHNGARVPKPGPWWQMPGAIHQLSIAALRLALKAAFQRDQFRIATMTAASKIGMDRDERLDLASSITGRNVDSFNELDPSEYAEVYDAIAARGMTTPDFEDTQAAPDPGPAAPVSPANPSAASGADHTQGHVIVESPVWDRAPGHEQGSAGDEPASAAAPGQQRQVAPAGHQGSAGAGEAGRRRPDEAPASLSGAPAEHYQQSSAGVISAPSQRATSEGTSVGVRTTPAPAEHYQQGSAGEQPGPPKAPGRSTPQAPPAEHHQQGSAGESSSPQDVHGSVVAGSTSPAEHHAQGSAGDERPGVASPVVPAAEVAVPAEHHTAEVSGEVAPADGTVPAGKSRSDTGLPSGPAPTKPAPTRKRQVDLADEARKAAVVRNAGRQEIYRPPTNWLHTLPIPERQMVLSYCHSNARAGGEWLREFATQEGLTPLDKWGEKKEWPEDKLALLRATIEAERSAK